MQTDPNNSHKSFIFYIVLLFLIGCHGDPKNTDKQGAVNLSGCRGCHDIILDSSHDLGCSTCHSGDDGTNEKEIAHANLISQPAHPQNMTTTCGTCHEKNVTSAASSLHFTLRNEINLVRKAFGAKTTLSSLTEIPIAEKHETSLALTDDLLRRRCLRCHVYSAGDTYSKTHRGTGCAACHLHFENGNMQSHTFLRQPSDDQCLHCHYGNRVGADYVGRYEQDLQREYRTPFVFFSEHSRPYGVEHHPLSSDIHAQAGLGCIDCHTGEELMGTSKMGGSSQKVSCLTCHDIKKAQQANMDNIEIIQGQIFLTGKFTGKKMPVPLPIHEAHKKYAGKADCVVCHAQWVFTDQVANLIRLDIADLDTWNFLNVQGSSSAEKAILQNDPFMVDTISGEKRQGAWIKSYMQRRWESPLIGKDSSGRLHIYRPILDLKISYVNEEGETIVDGFEPLDSSKLLPYSPHTIGPAGVYFENRLKPNLSSYLHNLKTSK